MCMTWSHKLKYLWKCRNLFLSVAVTAEYSEMSWLHNTEMELTSAYRERIVLWVECITNNSVREEASNVATAVAKKQCDILLNPQNSRDHWCQEICGKFTFFNWNMMHVSRYTQASTTVKWFSVPFYVNVEIVPAEFRIEICSLVLIWETYLGMLYSSFQSLVNKHDEWKSFTEAHIYVYCPFQKLVKWNRLSSWKLVTM
jgi:hypothetical protein